MKRSLSRLVFVSSVLFVGGLFGADSAPQAAAPVARITAEYVGAEKFTDFRDSIMESEKARASLMAQLNEHLASLGKFLPEGQRLELRFTDIDLAGDYEPWRGPDFDDIRIMKDIYIPRMKIDYKLLDASGAVIRSGSERISDMSYLMSVRMIPDNDPLRYDKNMLTDWIRREFRKSGK